MTDTISSLRAERDALKADIGRLLVAYGSRDEFDGIDEAIADALTMRRERDAARAEVESLRKTLAFTGPIHAQRLLRACQSLHRAFKREQASANHSTAMAYKRRMKDALEERDTLRSRVQALVDGIERINYLCDYEDIRTICRALLSATAQAPTADKKCECANPRSATGTLCWDCGRPMRDAPAQAKEEP